MRTVGLIRFQPYEGGNYAICRSIYQSQAVRWNSREACGRVVQYHNDRRGRRPYRVREDDRLDVVPYHASRQLGGWRPLSRYIREGAENGARAHYRAATSDEHGGEA